MKINKSTLSEKEKHLLKLTPSQEKIINVFKIPKKYFGKK